MNEAVRAILDNTRDYALAYTKAYLAFIEAGLPQELAQTEARMVGFMAVTPAAEPPNLTGFGPRESKA